MGDNSNENKVRRLEIQGQVFITVGASTRPAPPNPTLKGKSRGSADHAMLIEQPVLWLQRTKSTDVLLGCDLKTSGEKQTLIIYMVTASVLGIMEEKAGDKGKNQQDFMVPRATVGAGRGGSVRASNEDHRGQPLF
jgi:hypothetical protein